MQIILLLRRRLDALILLKAKHRGLPKKKEMTVLHGAFQASRNSIFCAQGFRLSETCSLTRSLQLCLPGHNLFRNIICPTPSHDLNVTDFPDTKYIEESAILLLNSVFQEGSYGLTHQQIVLGLQITIMLPSRRVSQCQGLKLC